MPEPSEHSACERFRVVAALHVDGESSSLELEAQAAHAAHCAECRAFAVRVGATTAHLRAASVQRPSHPIAVTGVRRRPGRRARRGPSLAAALLLASGILASGDGAAPQPEAAAAGHAFAEFL